MLSSLNYPGTTRDKELKLVSLERMRHASARVCKVTVLDIPIVKCFLEASLPCFSPKTRGKRWNNSYFCSGKSLPQAHS